MRRVAGALLVLTVLGIPAASARPSAGADARPAIDRCDWTSFRNGPRNPGASQCDGIGIADVSSLTPRFLYRTRDSVTSTPAVVDGVVYVGTWDGWFYAFDQPVGLGDPSAEEAGVTLVEPKWSWQIDDDSRVAFGRIVSSPSVADIGDTRVVVFAGGATLYALDAEDGTLLAKVCLDPRTTDRCQRGDSTIEVETSPVLIPAGDGERAVDVITGLDVHNRRQVGRTGVVKLRLEHAAGGWSFTPAWKFDPEAGAPYTGADLLTRGSGTGGGCGGVWGTPAVDAGHDIAVFGTASCLSGTPEEFVPAGEKVFAVRLSDGTPLWRYDPPRPWGLHTDDDFGASAQLFEVDGSLVAGIGGKDGWYYALDAVTGRQVWKTQVAQAGRLDTNFAIGGVIGSPALGRVGDRQALFVTSAISTPVAAPLDDGGLESLDTTLAEDPLRMLSLHAVDAATGAILWRQALTRQTYGHPTYANGIVYVPSTAGFSVQAYHADTGLPLWTSPPLNGAPSSGVAVTDGAIFVGAGTRQTDAGFKLTNEDSLTAELIGADPQERTSGIWGFATAG